MSIIHKFIGKQNDLKWEDVTIRENGDEFGGVTRQVFIGTEEDSNNFHMRYFHLEPGTHRKLESHLHEYCFLILHGNVKFQLNNEFLKTHPNDTYFSGNDLHQFVVQGDDEPLGFMYVIKEK
jgi:glyoxylate utilization-related uncharacterized protein